MKMIFAIGLCFLLGSTAVADNGFFASTLNQSVQQLNAQVQAAQLQHQAKLARQVNFLQQQQLVAANTVNVHAQLSQLRALQQAQALQAIHLSQLGAFHNPLAHTLGHHFLPLQQHVAVPVVQKQVVQQIIEQPVVVRQRVCQPGLFRSRICR